MPVPEFFTVHDQFPGYPTDTLPDLAGLEDRSWHNDACPSWCSDPFIIWVDWPNDNDREFPGGYRFTVARTDDTGCLTEDPELETDNWAEVQAHLKGKTQ